MINRRIAPLFLIRGRREHDSLEDMGRRRLRGDESAGRADLKKKNRAERPGRRSAVGSVSIVLTSGPPEG